MDPHSTPGQPEVANTLAQMVIADITFDREPFIQDTFYAVLSPNNFCAVAHLEHPTEGSKDAQGKATYRLACGIPLSEGEYRLERSTPDLYYSLAGENQTIIRYESSQVTYPGAGHQISSSIYESGAALSRTTFPQGPRG